MPEHPLEGRARDERLVFVVVHVAVVLDAVLENADDQKRHVVDEQRPPDGVFLAKDVADDLVAEKDGSPPLFLIGRVDEASPRLWDLIAPLAVGPFHADDTAVDGRLAIDERNAVFLDLSDDRRETAHSFLRVRGIVVGERNLSAGRQAPIGLRGLARPDDRDVPAHALRVFQDLFPEALSEGQKEKDGHGSPRDRRDGEDRPLLLQPGGLEEKMKNDGKRRSLHGFLIRASSRPRGRGATLRARGNTRRRNRFLREWPPSRARRRAKVRAGRRLRRGPSRARRRRSRTR